LTAKQNCATMAQFLPYDIAMTWHDLPTVVIKKNLPILGISKQNCTRMGNLPKHNNRNSNDLFHYFNQNSCTILL